MDARALCLRCLGAEAKTSQQNHNSRSACESERNQFAPELSRIMATFGPAAVEMCSIGPKHTNPMWLAPERCPAGTKPTAHRHPFDPDRGSDPLERHAGRLQPCRFLIARLPSAIGNLTTPPGSGGFDGIRCDHRSVGHLHDRLFGDLLADAANADMAAVDDGLDCVTKVARQVPAIGHLNGIRCPLADAVGVGSGTVACHNLDTGVEATWLGFRLADTRNLPVTN